MLRVFLPARAQWRTDVAVTMPMVSEFSHFQNVMSSVAVWVFTFALASRSKICRVLPAKHGPFLVALQSN